MQPLTVLMKQTRQAGRAIKKSIHLDVYGGAAKNRNDPILIAPPKVAKASTIP